VGEDITIIVENGRVTEVWSSSSGTTMTSILYKDELVANGQWDGSVKFHLGEATKDEDMRVVNGLHVFQVFKDHKDGE
jgi:hypothetical protein